MSGGNIVFIALAAMVLVMFWQMHRKNVQKKRKQLIASFPFPQKISEKIQQTYPHLSQQEVNQVIKALRDYFQVCNLAGRRMVAMPSQAVDVAWHEFILFTRKYQWFCNQALGRFLHHTPAEAMQSRTQAQEGIKRAWKIACHLEHISAKSPAKLPLLFALDAMLKIPDGFNYKLDCLKGNGDEYCASHIGCGGCGGGCGGDSGCGGGCGGD